jgi:hypothetical protein
MSGSVVLAQRVGVLLLLCGLLISAVALAQQPTAAPLGTAPPVEAMPRAEFVFEERVTLAPATVLGDTDLGHRQYIPITGGAVAGPKLKGEVIPGGWDFQLRYPDGCGTLSADYFLRAEDGTVIHILNQAFNCGISAPGGERSWLRPTFEAPKGSAYEWLTRGTFIASLELDMPPAPAAPAPPAAGSAMAIRIKFYQIK